jgi:hypothetical protein
VSDGTPRERAFKSGQEAAARAAEGAAALTRRRGRPIEPGDLCVLPEAAAAASAAADAADAADADHPAVEWAVLERDPADPRRLLAVPADTFPPVGAADVELPAGEAAGPLRLRCRYALWAEERVFARALRTGVLPPRVRRAAGEVCEALAEGSLRPSSLGEEAEADPEYRDWERAALAPARAALDRRSAGLPALDGGGAGAERKSRLSEWSTRLAAVFFLATVGLTIWAGLLQQRLGVPITGSAATLAFGQRSGEVEVEVAPGADFVPLSLTDLPADPWRVEIRNAEDRAVWSSEGQRIADGEVLVPRRADLPDGLYEVVLLDRRGAVLSGVPIRVLTKAPETAEPAAEP